MRVAFTVVLLAACADPSQPPSDPAWSLSATDHVAPPPYEPTVLSGGPLRVGYPVNFLVSNANPYETVYLLASANGPGNGPCPDAIGGVCLGILPPLKDLGRDTANSGGYAHFTITVPEGSSLSLVHLQAVSPRGLFGRESVVSNVLEVEVLEDRPRAELVREGAAMVGAAYSGTEDVVLTAEEGQGEVLCHVRYDLDSIAQRNDCPACDWAFDLRISNAAVVIDQGACLPVLGVDASTVSSLDGTVRSYGYDPDYVGHAEVLVFFDGQDWIVVSFAVYDHGTGDLTYDWFDGYYQ